MRLGSPPRSVEQIVPPGQGTRVPILARGRDVLATIATLALLAIVLERGVGLPHVPPRLPSWIEVQIALQSPDALPPWAIDLVGLLGWAFWLWVAGTLLIQLGLAVAERLTRSARWVLSLRRVADRITLPIIRRAARQAAVAVTVLQLASRVTPVAAAPTSGAAAALVAERPMPATLSAALSTLAPQHAQAPQSTTYTVQSGDSLWAIADRFYGDGELWTRIFAANVGRPMRDGETFPRSGVIQPGWVLLIPEPTTAQPSAQAPEPVYYVVQPSDTLSDIARRYYGDEAAWPRIFAANRGAHAPDGQALTDPSTIWPGLRLLIPEGPAPAATTNPGQPATVSRAPSAHSSAAKTSGHTATPTKRPALVSPRPTTAPGTTPRLWPPSRVRRDPMEPSGPDGADKVPLAPVRPATSPSPRPAVPAPEATHAASAAPHRLPPPLFAPGAASLAGALAGAGVVLLARRRFRTSLDEPPIPHDADAGVAVREGFADAGVAPTFAGRFDGGTEPAVLVAEQVLAWLAAENGLADVALVMGAEGRHTMQLTVQATLAAQQRLLALAAELAERLGADGDAVRTPDHDVLLRLSKLTLLRLAARPLAGPVPPVPLIALGVMGRGEVLHANWNLLGHILIAGLAGGDRQALLASLLTALAARCHPELLRVWIIAPRATFPPPLLDLPHACDRGVDIGDALEVGRVCAAVRAEFERRMQAGPWSGPSAEQPELVLVISERYDLADDGLLELLGRQGPDLGMRLLVATTRPETMPDTLLESFETRLILHTPDAVQSVRLLGQPDAADLDSGGDLWARVAGRAPVRLHGFRVEPEFLDRLVDRMHASFAEAAPVEQGPTCKPADASGPDGEIAAQAASPGNQPKVTPSKNSAPGGVPSTTAATSGATVPDAQASVVPQPVTGVHPPDGRNSLSEHRNGHANGLTVTPASVAPKPVDDPIVTVAAPRVNGASSSPDAIAARVQICCFGELCVRSGHGVLTPRGNQLPWEMLVYLALHEPGKVAKGDLMGALWPSTEPAQGGPRIRMAMVRLRDLLAELVPDLPSEVVRIERDGVCLLDPDLVWSDAQQFLSRCEAARREPGPPQRLEQLEAALALYGDGLFSQLGFRWMDQRRRGASIRQRYRERHARATVELARGYAETGHPERAIPLYRELLDAEPTLQAVARELYRCYGATGDRAALVEEHERLAEALAWRRRQAEQEGRPDPGTRLEAATLAVYDEVVAELDTSAPQTRSRQPA